MVNLSGVMSIASSGLSDINNQFGVVSQNIANASTPGYMTEVANQTSLTAGGMGSGVLVGATTVVGDAALQGQALLQNATVSGLQTTQSALATIDAVNGTPGQGTDLASLLGNLQNGFSTLATAPDNATQQAQVVADAATLATGINTLSAAYGTARQNAQNQVVGDINTLNTTLGTIGQLSDQIIAAQAQGQSTADLQNQRNTALQSLSGLIDVKVLNQQNGDVLLVTGGGLSLPIHGQPNPFSTAPATLGAGAYAPGGGIPPIMLGGSDVTAQLTGGQLGATLKLRDQTLPTYQGELDEFSQNLAGRFDAQGLRLFSDPSGNVPAGGGSPVQAGYVGFASAIQVNPAVSANPALVRDGTEAIAGSATGASAFTPNPPGGPAGFTTMITRVLNFALGAQVQPGVPQPASNTTGLGPNGTLNAPYGPQSTLGGTAAALVGAESQDSANATSALSTEQGVQASLQNSLTSKTGVNMDAQMSQLVQLQNSYGANARVIAAVQAVWTQLLTVVQ